MTKILVVSNKYPRFEQDSSVVFLKTLYEWIALNIKGEVHIIAADDMAVDDDYAKPNNLFLHRFGYWFKSRSSLGYGDAILSNLKKNRLNYFLVPFFIMAMFLKCLHTVRRIRPDLIHAHWAFPGGYIAGWISKWYGIPLITTSHGGDIYGLKSFVWKRMLRFAFDRSARILPVSDALAEEIRASYGFRLKMKVLPMGIDLGQFVYTPDAHFHLGFDPNYRYVLFVGRLSEKKGVTVLLEAFHDMTSSEEKKSKIRLLVVGTGNLEVRLKQQVKEYGLVDAVKFIGEVPNHQLKYYYSVAHTTVIPSITSTGGQEGLPVVLMEALSCGCNIVATKNGGMAGMGHVKGILLVDQNDPEKLSTSLVQSLRSPRYGDSTYAANFSIEKIGQQHLREYNSVMAN